MAIRILKAVPATELVGKFICAPSLMYEQDHGFPGVIERATNAQLVYRRLVRGEWDPVEKEWQVNPDPAAADSDERMEGSRKCKNSSIKFVCDTAAEAIALYTQATATRKAIEAFRSAAHAELLEQVMQGQLPVPGYLQGRGATA